MLNFLTDCLVRKLKDYSSAAASNITDATIVDMQGYEGVVFVTDIGTANAGNYLKAEQGAESDLSDAADIAGSKVIAAANGDVVALDLAKPSARYVRPVVVRGASTTCGPIYAIQYGAKATSAVDNNVASSIVSETHVSPSTGTA